MKILFIRFGKAGDLVLITPILEVLKENSIKVDFLLSKKYYSILSENPAIEKFFFIEDGLFYNIGLMRKEKYEYIFDFDKKPLSLLYSLFLLPVKIKRVKKNTFRRRLSVYFKIKTKKFHFSELFYEKIKKTLKLKNKLPMPCLYGEKIVKNLPESYAVFFVGASHAKKRWPMEYYEKLGIKIFKEFGIKVVILGDEKDKRKGMFQEDFFIDLRGKTDWKELFYIIKNSLFVISNDTVGVHIADAYQKTIFEIYGATIPEFGFAPRGESFIFETKLPCRPCSLHGEGKCNYDFACLKEIKPETVLEKVREWLLKKC